MTEGVTKMTTPEHLTEIVTARGFTHLPAIPSEYGGGATVYDPPAASGPHLWLKIVCPESLNEPAGPTIEAVAHMTVENAVKYAEQILKLAGEHYQIGPSDPEPADMKTTAQQDEYENSLIAAGAVLAILASSRNAALQSVDPVVDAEGNATNQLDIELGFMASPYRITIERVVAPDEKAKEAPE